MDSDPPIRALRALVRAQSLAPGEAIRETHRLATHGRFVHAIEVALAAKNPALEAEIRLARTAARHTRGAAPEAHGELQVLCQGEMRTTWGLTVRHALDQAPPEVRARVLGPSSESVVVFCLGARDRADSEGGMDFALFMRLLRRDIDVYLIGPEMPTAAPQTLQDGKRRARVFSVPGMYSPTMDLPKPSLVALFCPGLDLHFDTWEPTLRALIYQQVLVLITGYSGDQSVVQDEEIAVALGAKIVSPTELNPYGWNRIDGQFLVKNYSFLSFLGGEPADRSPKEVLIARGFEIP